MFRINDHIIGGSKAYIIAEIGINHQGSVHKCRKLIHKAKISGADAVKLQICNPKYSYNADTLSYKLFKKNFLNLKDLEKVSTYAKKLKITLFATPGDFQSLDLIKKLNFPAVKVSSGLLTNEALIHEISNLKKPVILSTGMAFMTEVKKAVQILKKKKINNFAILKCTSIYPCDPELVNLNSIKTLQKVFPKKTIGFSDHTTNIDSCVAAVALGAKVIEKHLTLNKNLKVPDQKVSCDPSEFKTMVKKIRYIETILGEENIFPTNKEIKKRHNFHRSIISIKKISIGETFNKENIALKRSTGKIKGLHPKFFLKILGKKSKKNIKSNVRINKKHFNLL